MQSMHAILVNMAHYEYEMDTVTIVLDPLSCKMLDLDT
jgi:hypothetical protein